MSTGKQRHVVVVGGGFGGLAAVQELAKDRGVRITLVDQRNHHLFQPLLYQVATAALSPSDIAEPLRGILAPHKNVDVRLAKVSSVDLPRHQICLSPVMGERASPEWLKYDQLILATGVSHAYFGHDNWSEDAPGLKSIGDALEIRRRILLAFEKAETTPAGPERDQLLTFVVVGGGPTGVELAGAIAEIATQTLREDFRQIDTRDTRVILVEASESLLSTYDPQLQEKAKAQLRDLGVELQFGTPVSDIDSDGVTIGGEVLAASTVLWAAGVSAGDLTRPLAVPQDRAGRLEVTPYCELPDHPEVFAIGDLAHLEVDGAQIPGVAPAAQQMGRFVARRIRGFDDGPFRYKDKGSMATIGKSKAIMESGKIKMSGFPAWVAWGIIHLWFLVSYRSRFVVFSKWAWAWLRNDRSSRLIWQSERSATPLSSSLKEIS